MQRRKGNVAGATSGDSSGPPTSPPLLCCCCCAAVVVLRSSCVSLLCIPRLCSFTLEIGAVHASSHKNLQFYCCVVPPVVAHLKKTQGWNFEVCSPNKKERQVSPPSPLLLTYAIAAAALLLLLCYTAAVVFLSSFGFVLCSDCADSPQLYPWYQLQPTKYTYVKRRCWKNNAGCLLNTNLFPAWYRPNFFFFHVYQVDYSSRLFW